MKTKGPSENNLKGTMPSKPKMDYHLIDGRPLRMVKNNGRVQALILSIAK